jgi:hypothetical protein
MGVQAKTVALATQPKGSWVQTERAAHEKWAKLSISNPRASSLLHVLTHRMGRHNALIASQSNLARMACCSVATIKRSIDVLRKQNWIEVRQIGESGTVCAYIINDRVAWSGKRDGIRYSLFSAAVIVSDNEQPDEAELEHQPALTRIPSLYPGERQLPTGDGLPPPSEPALPGLEPDLPATDGGSFKVSI